MNDGANLTYSNYKEGRKQLYMEGGIPLAKKIYNAITRKLQPYYRDNPTIVVDTDNIEAIQEDKKFAMERLTKAVDGGILTANEARVELGYPLAKGPTADMLQNAKIVNNIPKPDEKIDEELVEQADEQTDEQVENIPDQPEEQ
jgi:phage portal protein BeeE